MSPFDWKRARGESIQEVVAKHARRALLLSRVAVVLAVVALVFTGVRLYLTMRAR